MINKSSKQADNRKAINLPEIEAGLKTKWLGRAKIPNEFWPTIKSTNDRALEIARSDNANGVIVIASHQSAGRGRSGNQWLSPAGTGLYLSFITSPRLAAEHWPVITLITGVAVARAVQAYLGVKVGLKWVNDIILDGKKIGGILAEYVPELVLRDKEKPTLEDNFKYGALVIGIGLNLYKPYEEMSLELQQKIGFTEDYLTENGIQTRLDPNQLVIFLANELENSFELMHRDLPSELDQWRAYSVTLGEQIQAMIGDEQIKGEAVDITDKGELLVETAKGHIILRAGEISIRKTDGSYA